MKNRITTILGFVIVFALLATMGCKDNKKAPVEPREEIQLVEDTPSESVDLEVVMKEADSIGAAALNMNGAVIRLIVKDPKSLFDNPGSSNIEAGNPGLAYIAMESTGMGKTKNTDDSTSAKDFISDVYKGNQVVWIVSIEPQAPNRNDYNISVQQIEMGSDDPQSCKAFEESLHYPSSGILVRANVKDQAGVVGCLEQYAIWFELEKVDGSTRAFRLDPFILVNN